MLPCWSRWRVWKSWGLFFVLFWISLFNFWFHFVRIGFEVIIDIFGLLDGPLQHFSTRPSLTASWPKKTDNHLWLRSISKITNATYKWNSSSSIFSTFFEMLMIGGFRWACLLRWCFEVSASMIPEIKKQNTFIDILYVGTFFSTYWLRLEMVR